MRVTCYGATSKGNSYRLTIGGSSILIDAGIKRKRMIAQGFATSEIEGIFVTHSHGDHCSAISDFSELGVPIYVPSNIPKIDKFARCTGLRVMDDEKPIHLKKMQVVPFALIHDVECYGFLIGNQDEKVVYITDTGVVLYTFSNLTHIMIEANHSMKALYNSYHSGMIDQKQYDHIMHGHLSIEQAIRFVQQNINPRLEAVYLTHLSDRHANGDEFKERMQRATGIPTYIMRAGVEYGR